MQTATGTLNQAIDIQEISIVLAVQNNSPTLLNADFLKASGIIGEWALARPPVCNANGSQILFQNQINLVALPDQLNFSEGIGGKTPAEIQVPAIASKYLATLPQLDYQAIGINPRGHVVFDDLDAAQTYMRQTLLAPGSWQELNQRVAKPSLRLSYTLETGNLFLGIETAMLRLPGQEMASAVVMFSGNFNYPVVSTDAASKLPEVQQQISYWQRDLEIFRELINHKFLQRFAH